MSIQWNKELYHYGVPRRSGRYKWGSGEDPYHHGASAPRQIRKQYKQDMKSAKAEYKANKGSDKKSAKAALKNERTNIKIKAYDARKQYAMQKLDPTASSIKEKTEKKMLKKGVDSKQAKAIAEAKANKYKAAKEYDYDFTKMYYGDKYLNSRPFKVNAKENSRLTSSAYKTVAANKKYRKEAKAAKTSIKANRLKNNAEASRLMADANREAARTAKLSKPVYKSNEKYYRKQADKYEKKLSELRGSDVKNHKYTKRGRKKVEKYLR